MLLMITLVELIVNYPDTTQRTSWRRCLDSPESGVSVLVVEVINECLGTEHLAHVEKAHERVRDGPAETGGVICFINGIQETLRHL